MEIWIPESAHTRPKWVCRVCKAGFKAGQYDRFQRHVISCANEHEAALDAASPRHDWFNQQVDPEFGEYWARKLQANPRAIEEGES